MRAMVTARTAAGLTTDVHELLTETFGPVIESGRLSGEIRGDVSTDQVMQWIVEQLYLAIQQPDRDPIAVRDRLRLFAFPHWRRVPSTARRAPWYARTSRACRQLCATRNRRCRHCAQNWQTTLSVNSQTNLAERESPPRRSG